jgi:hypothetical protein
MVLLQEPEQTHVVEILVFKTYLEQHSAVSQNTHKHIKNLTLYKVLIGLKYAGNYFFELMDVGAT